MKVYYTGSQEEKEKIEIGEGVFEESAVWTVNSCGDGLTWAYDEATETLTIQGQGAMKDYLGRRDEGAGMDRIDAPWANLKVKNLVLEEGVTSVGVYAFYNMPCLTGSLELPSSLETIGERAFTFTDLTSVKLNEGLKTIGEESFRGCSSLTLGGGFPDSLETVAPVAFYQCSALKGEICFGSSLKTLGGNAFSGSGITKVTLPDRLTAEGYSVWTFAACQLLTEILVSEGNKSFRSIDGVLYSADGKTLLSGPAGKTGTLTVPQGVEVITQSAFRSGRITAVELPKSLKSIEENAFLDSAVTKVIYAGSWEDKADLQLNGNLENATWRCIGESASDWSYDENTKTLTVGGEGTVTKAEAWSGLDIETLAVSEGITAIWEGAFAGLGFARAELPASLAECAFADAFSGCGKLTEVQLAEGNEHFVSVDGAVYSKEQTTLLFCPAGRTKSLSIPDGTVTIAAKALYNSQIQELFLPASVTKVEQEAFYNAALRRVTYLGTQETKDQITVETGNDPFTKSFWKMGETQDIGDGLAWTYDGESQTLTISGSGRMDDFLEAFPAPWQGETVTKLVVEEGVIKLGSRGFAGLALESMTLPESLDAIGENAFTGTPQGIRITYAGSNEHWTYGVQKDGCGLVSPNVTANGENVSYDLTWSYDAETKTLTFSGSGEMDIYSQSWPDWLAWGIPAEKVVFSDNVTLIGSYAFYGMTSLKQVTLPEKLKKIDMYSFQGSGLTGKLTIPGDSVSIGMEAFRGTDITSVVLPFDFTITAEGIFTDCSQLTTVIYPGSEEELRQRLEGKATGFAQAVMFLCQAVDGGDLGNGVYWTLDKQGTLTIVTRESTKYGSVPDFGSYADTPWAGLTIKKLVIPENISAIGDNAFNGCKTLPGELTLPKYLVRLGDNAFAGTGIKTLRMQQNLASEEMEDIREHGISVGFSQTAFAGSKLTDVYYSGAESSLRELLGEGHPLLKKKLHCASRYGGWDNRPEQGIVMEWAIDSKGVLSFPTGDVIPDYKPLDAPWSGYKITGLNLKGVTSIGSNAFYGLLNLTKLSIPNTVKTIGDQAFYGCIGITGALTIPEGVTEIGNGAFGNLPKITALKLPASLESLGDEAFDGCIGLKTVTFAGSMAQLKELNRDLLDLGAAITCQGSSAGTLDCGANWTLDGKNTLTIEGTGTLTLTSDERDMLNDLGVRKMVIKPGITEIGEKGFFDMNITEVSLPASLESLGRYALDNYYIKTVTVAKGSKFLAVKSGILYSLDMKKLLLVPTGIKKLTIPDSVTTVAEGALANNSLTTLVLGAGIGPDSVEGDMGLAGLLVYNDITSLTVSKKNKQLRASGNVLFTGSTLVLYPYLRPGTEYRVPEGTTAIAKNAFREKYGFDFAPFYDLSFQYLRKLVLPASLQTVEEGGIQGYNLELVVLGKETAIEDGNICGRIWCPEDSLAAAFADKNGIHWNSLIEETVTLHFDAAGTGAAGMPKDIPNVTPGGQVAIPKKAPSRKGYTFRGWQEENGETIYKPGAALTLTKDMTLVPLFRKNGIVQEGSCGDDTRWTLDKNGTLTISGTGAADEYLEPETQNPITAKKLVIVEGVTKLDDIFDSEDVLIKGEVVIPASMETICEDAFYGQKGITKLTFASSIDAKGLTIEEHAFENCTGIKGAVTLPAQLAEMDESAFDGCRNITALNTATTITKNSAYTSVDGVLYGAGGRTLLRCPEGKTGAITIPTATKSIGSGAFWNSRVTKVYYQNGEAGWKEIAGREYLPVYPTVAYEISYSIRASENTNWMSYLFFKNPNPNSILSSQTVTLKNPTMRGYLFLGWYNEAGKKVTKIAKGTKDTVRLEARFAPITYTVAYNANGGKGEPPRTSIKYDMELTVADNGFTRTGYTFKGWNTAKNGTGKMYQPGDTPSNLTTKNKGTVTLYAQWKANSYTVKFDANVPEGMQYSGAMEPQSFTYDKAQPLTANGFARTGYTFTGWKTQPNSKTVYKNKASVKNLTSAVDGEVTLYAQWAARKITVVFHSNYPTSAKEKTAKQTIICGKEVKLAKNTFAVKGYTFAGWSETRDGEVKYTNTQSNTFYSDKTIDLYAVWTPIILQ